MTTGIFQRNGRYRLIRRVPARFSSIETRTLIEKSLHTDSLPIARRKAEQVWNEMLEAWEAKLAGETDVAEERFAAARSLADKRGYRFMNAAEVARLPAVEIVARVEQAFPRGRLDAREADAALGLVDQPEMTVADALAQYWPLAEPDHRGKSKDQLRRWRNPILKAFRNFEAVNGTVTLQELGSDHMLDWRQWWAERLVADGLTSNSANKDFIHFSKVLRRVESAKRLRIDLSFLSGHAFKERGAKTRKPFSVAHIRAVLLKPGALDGLNVEARCILLGMVNTGYRPSEGANLLPGAIRLDAEIPHISIEEDGREVKSASAIRTIPLVGVSLDAFRMCPRGFPRYHDKPGLTATVNKYLREHGLMESAEHTLYGLRHSFEDRLRQAGIDDRVRRDLHGHTLDRERYGETTLDEKLKALRAISL
ncbi:DUF6538 domain-containing protein [Tropicimonas sp. IMCC34011]|uniref:DUF6538 domain-containing protein n=1 Tax=Tropicimonas sp. IMCC34011 TaxID=2248759 RepID=UPI000E254DE3|nr:DUF6538 domain-containing protein [Tropicimonas sp. IMCC34011]